MSDEEAPVEEVEEEEVPVEEEAPAEEEAKAPAEEEAAPVEKEAPSGGGGGASDPIESPSDAWEKISRQKTDLNWFLYSVTKKMKLKWHSGGSGGLKELRTTLESSKSDAFFGLLRVNSTDKGGSVRAKFIFIRFVGSGVPVMTKAKITPNSGKFADNFPVKHLTFDLDENVTGFAVGDLAKEFLRVGGAHKPDAYVFGPGADQTFNCT